ncbi:MAG TPA: hypothetical protein VGX00_00090 [Thermoplasmata archaeon]|nr:hypothetical protein [Thermoplasmata archaeon]
MSPDGPPAAIGGPPPAGDRPIGTPSTGPGFSDTPPASRARPATAWRFWVVIVVTIALVGGLVAYSTLGSSGSKTTVLEKNGSGVDIPAGAYLSISVSVSKSSTLSGTLHSSDGVLVFVMGPSVYSEFKLDAKTSGAIWSSGVLHDGSFDVSLAPGSWDIVFESPEPSLPTEFVMTSDLAVTGPR